MTLKFIFYIIGAAAFVNGICAA